MREQGQLGGCCRNPGKKGGSSDWGGHRGGGGEWLEFASVLKAEPRGFPDGLEVGCEKKGGGRVTSDLSLERWKDRVATDWTGSLCWGNISQSFFILSHPQRHFLSFLSSITCPPRDFSTAVTMCICLRTLAFWRITNHCNI